VPDAETLPEFVKSQLGLMVTDMEELCKLPEVKTAILKAMENSAKQFNLKGFEKAGDHKYG